VKLFVPDWDDRVDPDFDFERERFVLDRNPRTHDRYVYEVLDGACDGVLISRSAVPTKGPKAEDIRRLGLRAMLRVPDGLEIFGDCGAFTYVAEKQPPYSTTDICSFYAEHAVDYGVSVDHIARFFAGSERLRRYDLTLDRALEFLSVTKLLEGAYVPVGAVQGWDERSYASAAERLAAAGYRYLALGGLVRSSTTEIRTVTEAVRAAVGPSVSLHVLGVARLDLLADLVRLGVASFDSASPIRTAWTSARRNYLLNGEWFTAVRVPFAEPRAGLRGRNSLKRADSKRAVELRQLEQSAIEALRAYGADGSDLDGCLEAVGEYDQQFTRRTASPAEVTHRLSAYRTTLERRPWESCTCSICTSLGIDVLLFRGSNRNRRRGFHNLLQVATAVRERVSATAPPLERNASFRHAEVPI
jgi:hypothetical protein